MESNIVAPPIVEESIIDPPIVEPVAESSTVAPSNIQGIDLDGSVAESTTARTTDVFPVAPLDLGDGITLNPLPANIDDPINQQIVNVEQENVRMARMMRPIEASRTINPSSLD